MSFFSHLFHSTPSEDDVDLVLYAPLNGTLVPLSEVPDVVIAEKVVGDGVALIPDSETILAPCDGTIARLLATNTAFSIKTEQGLEIYVTFGIDTIDFQGEGFSARAQVGQSVKRGDPIIQVDMSVLGDRIKSTVTSMIVVRSSGAIDHVTAGSGKAVAAVTPCAWVTLEH
ncbi:MAG: glucose PTS transporter subunit IIA [Candidatus Anaerobiospirillum merdipullorum]|uniref:PTS system glucose-specific EIIA component n=1 Tax=Candidatus Anaerobiospirillum merdipullorum TaxID=2838450 RepID=A0A9E2KQ17_9GAMM|nr:glucose PTS transporter subunit IIA [Candidatus Anaerobiospirillum merdipullorum]